MTVSFEDIAIAGGDTAQPHAMSRRLKALEPFIQPGIGRFLDCGCGSGAYVAAIRNQFRLDVHGVEHDSQKVEAAWRDLGLEGRVTQGDLQAIEGTGNSWDYALLNEVLEHIPNDRAALAEVHRLLKSRGHLFVFSPNRRFPFETHGVYWRHSGRPVPNWVPFLPYVPLALGQRVFRYWARNYWPGELGRLVESAGFRIIHRSYLGMTFENISGRQPAPLRAVRPLLRAGIDAMQKCPGLRSFGVSQFLVCRK
ncbi:MAG: methyltransferase domain-containing protein [Verrucomicrobia bacterium]|nr:methyltransferase domain-containing protein [Verrucomicrobiota bacterium]